MPRNRRRRGRGRPAGTGAKQSSAPRDPAAPSGSAGAAGRRRRGRGRGRGRGPGGGPNRPVSMASALQEMAGPRPKQLQTLPADGVILEELIADLQTEYGFPATPQEYRLLIKVPVSAEAETSSTEAPRSEDQPPQRPTDSTESPTRTPRRRRSRRRRGRPPNAQPPGDSAP